MRSRRSRHFRDLIVKLTGDVAGTSVSTTLGLVLDRSGYLQDLRDERSEEAEGRVENLMELVSAAREYESRDADATLGGFVDRLSLSPKPMKPTAPRKPASG